MTWRKRYMWAISTLLGLSVAALAEESDKQKEASKTDQAGGQAQEFRLTRCKHIIGQEVKNPQGEQLGKIKDLAVDVDCGHAAYAVVDARGLIGGQLHAVPFRALTFEMATEKDKPEQRIVLDMSKDKLSQAPGFDDHKWPNMADAQFEKEIHTYYGVQPYREREMNRERRELRGEPTSPEAREAKPADAAAATNLCAEGALFNRDVKTATMEDAGDIQDLLVDRTTGHVIFAVVKFDDAKEITSKHKDELLAAVPWTSLTLAVDDKGEATYTLKPSLDAVESQLFSENKWPDISDEKWAKDTYAHYGVEPCWGPEARERMKKTAKEGESK